MTPTGNLKISWLKKIAEYKEFDKVQLIYQPTADFGSNSSLVAVNGTAKQVMVDSLIFGQDYSATLRDLTTGLETFQFSFTACKF